MEQPNYQEYVTVDGDTFDIVSIDFYDTEFLAHILIEANPDYAQVLRFDAGITLKIPYKEEETVDTLPPWRR